MKETGSVFSRTGGTDSSNSKQHAKQLSNMYVSCRFFRVRVRVCSWNQPTNQSTPSNPTPTHIPSHRPTHCLVGTNPPLLQLQNLDCTTEVFVSLNPHTPPDPALVHKTLQYRHPQFSPRAESGQRLLSSINGKRGLWFCGAWRGYGFHEVIT